VCVYNKKLIITVVKPAALELTAVGTLVVVAAADGSDDTCGAVPRRRRRVSLKLFELAAREAKGFLSVIRVI
jgi:hypothetical protein